MTFKKLALASAIACAPMAALAVESLDDADLSATTGQDGLTLTLDLNLSTDTIIHDTDGITGITGVTSYANAGAIVISGMSIVANDVTVTIDAGDEEGTVNGTSHAAPMLNVNVNLSTGVTLVTGDIGVANSNRDNAGAWGIDSAGSVGIMNSMTVSLGATQLNVQLGSEQQGATTGGTTAMIHILASINGGIQLGNMGLNDANSGGTIGSTLTTLADHNGTSLFVDVEVNVNTSGLELYINRLGDAVDGMDVRIEDMYLGSTSAGIIGDIEMQRLNLNGTSITISGN